MQEIVLLNHPKVRDYYKEDTHNKISVLLTDDIDKVRRSFGRASRRWRGEFQFHVWDIEFEGYTLNVYVETIGDSFILGSSSNGVLGMQSSQIYLGESGTSASLYTYDRT